MRKGILLLALWALGCAPAAPRLTAHGISLGDSGEQVVKLLGKPNEVRLGREYFAGVDVKYKDGRVVLLNTDQVEVDGKVFKGSRAIREGLIQSFPDRRGPSPMEIYLDAKNDVEIYGAANEPRVELKRVPPAGVVDRKGTMDPPGGTPLPD